MTNVHHDVTRSATVQNTLTIYIISVKRHSITGQHLSTFILIHGDLPIRFSAICTLFPLVLLGHCRCRQGFFDVEVHSKSLTTEVIMEYRYPTNTFKAFLPRNCSIASSFGSGKPPHIPNLDNLRTSLCTLASTSTESSRINKKCLAKSLKCWLATKAFHQKWVFMHSLPYRLFNVCQILDEI